MNTNMHIFGPVVLGMACDIQWIQALLRPVTFILILKKLIFNSRFVSEQWILHHRFIN